MQHREWVCTGPFCWGGHSWQWVDRSVASLSLHNGYDPWPGARTCPPDQCPPPAPPRSCAAENRSSLDCWDWAIFTGPAQLNIKTVHAWGTAFLPGGGALSLGPVENSFWF